ncbi:shikimate dehydrogenase family protein [Flavobacterium aciduliphilum]|uniref:Shikimate dehydrogenase n=1 Tax=Flavobacterium aciduliphilum TaxID=1101402 RepID=A0A328YZ75_9FLAO|nr:shikimate dehydrogenase [Flavobacterium aciduliphilum]RAR75376.1 shikimate dehydrogenase [Flavobacterium aciduliphilum]
MPPTNSKYGLLGKNISYSFSKKYFTEKFSTLHLNCTYENFDIPSLEDFKTLLQNNPDLKGLNVTIPYKEAILPYLDALSKKASKIGAVNVIRITKKGKLKGYNSDWYGLKKSLFPLLENHHKKALLLGTGGAAKAVAFALEQLQIPYRYVSRTRQNEGFVYDELNQALLEEYQIIINCTPLGTSPNTDACPPIPYQHLTKQHIAFDLIYNPEETTFLSRAKAMGAQTQNGYQMLVFQAEKAWKIWNK